MIFGLEFINEIPFNNWYSNTHEVWKWLKMTSEIDELAESIMDCVMNSHHIPDAGISYVESFLPTKP